MTDITTINEEIRWRKELLNEIGGETVNVQIDPMLLRNWSIYGGAQGVWVDKKRTGSLTEDGNGLAVGLLHKGNLYPDDFDDTGVIYHYPATNRPKSRDLSEIEAVKNCGKLGVPIFVITVSIGNLSKRDVYFGYVTLWDDRAKAFIIEFGHDQPQEELNKEEEPFNLNIPDLKEKYEATRRPDQAAFRISVFRRYGFQCAVCGMSVIDLLDAAHLVPKSKNGSDDPRNGLPLCALHHRAFDKNLFSIDPQSLSVVFKPNGTSASDFYITKNDISHLSAKPHQEALRNCWENWRKLIGAE